MEKKALSKLSGKDVEKLGKDIYKSKIAAQLSSNQVSAILKSDELTESDKDKFKKARTEGIVAQATNFKYSDIENILKEDLDESQKNEIKDARIDGLDKLVTGTTVITGVPQDEAVKKAMENMDGKELEKYVNKIPPGAPHAFFTAGIKSSHLKNMEGLSAAKRKDIADAIDTSSMLGPVHQAQGHVNKNRHLWS